MDEFEQRFCQVLSEAVAITEKHEVPYLLAGSLAFEAWARPGGLGDIDLFIDPRPAKELLEAFRYAGYQTEETFPTWLFKATKSGITVDLIFEMAGPLYLEPQMLERGSRVEVRGVEARVMGPEDYVLSQAMALKEDTVVYWRNAIAVLQSREIDWDYLADMASRGPRMVLALLVLAREDRVPVPAWVFRRIYRGIFPDGSEPRTA
jgi:predicted nucleotidyltransferase